MLFLSFKFYNNKDKYVNYDFFYFIMKFIHISLYFILFNLYKQVKSCILKAEHNYFLENLRASASLKSLIIFFSDLK